MRQGVLPLVALATLRLPVDAVFSGFTAGWLHGLDIEPCRPIEITLPRLATTSRRSGMAVRRSDLAPGEICQVRGFPATTRIRTIADICRHFDVVEAVVVLDMALRQRIVTIDELSTWASEHAGYHGLRRLRRALELGDGGAQSPMETRLRLLLIFGGLPKPSLQVSVYDDTGGFIGRPDLYYPHAFLAIEYDGGTHRASVTADNRRQNRLLAAGYRLLRFSGADVLGSPASVVGQVERALDYPVAARRWDAGV